MLVVAGELETRAYGDVRDSIGRPSDNGQLAALDPDCRMIGLHIYGGMLKVRNQAPGISRQISALMGRYKYDNL